MADILIRGMEMPKEGFAEVLIKSDGTVIQTGQSKRFNGRDYYTPYKGAIPVLFKAISVPPHGRLIDADALAESIKDSLDECHKWANQAVDTFAECALRVKNAPIIIPASEVDRDS